MLIVASRLDLEEGQQGLDGNKTCFTLDKECMMVELIFALNLI